MVIIQYELDHLFNTMGDSWEMLGKIHIEQSNQHAIAASFDYEENANT